MREYAIEADPGKCTASFPIFGSYAAARNSADAPVMHRPGIPLPRVLTRVNRSAWVLASEDLVRVQRDGLPIGSRFVIPTGLRHAGTRGTVVAHYQDVGAHVRLDEHGTDTVLFFSSMAPVDCYSRGVKIGPQP